MDEIIKFRAKATSEVAPNLWVHGYCFKRFEQDRLVAYISDGSIDVPAREETICRYTGLKDKHGHEIYEHDILSFIFAGDCYIGEVIFEQGIYWFKSSTGESYCYDDVYDIEVVGNSFDNPELIKNKNI